jgi:hypothetical protein
MYDPSSDTLQMAADAAEKLIGFYPSISASDPKVYAAGLVQLFSRYPEHLIAKAVDPVEGLPSLHDFPPSMKQAKEFLEPRWQAEVRQKDMIDRFNRKRLPEPPPNPETDKHILEGLQKLSFDLKRGVGP